MFALPLVFIGPYVLLWLIPYFDSKRTMLVPVLAILPVTYVYSMRLYKRRHPEE